jgi:hypothetical protein
MIGTYTEDPLLQKLYFLVCMLGINYFYFLLSGILSSSSKKSWSEITDKSFLGSFAVLFGLLVYYDLDDAEVVRKFLPQINEFYTEKWFSLMVIMLPMIFLSLVKILFSDP